MNRWTLLLAAMVLCVGLAAGCSSGGVNPVAPNDLTGRAVSASEPQTHLWSYYDVYIDIDSQTATAVLNRSAMFTANVVQFVNGKAANLQFNIIGTPQGPGYVDVDIDVTISHPFPGLHQYDGYDVRGVFVGNGSQSMGYNGSLMYSGYGIGDQVMHDYNATAGDPHAGLVGMPDGYTRWFNPVEFLTPGILGYTPGKFATPGYTGTATLNPYKYFADGLGVADDLWTFLTSTTNFGVFAAGSSNTRNYYLRFPLPSPGVKYGYAITANWIDETTHPANAPEAVGLSTNVTPDVYYESSSNNGGKLILDMNFSTNWGILPSAIFIESTVLNNPYQLTPSEMVPVAGGTNYSTYHVEIQTNNVNAVEGNEFWVIAQYDDFDYTNDLGVPNNAGLDKLAAFFRYDLYVSPVPYDMPPICDLEVVTPMPAVGFAPLAVEFDATGSHDPDPWDSMTYAWDFDGDNIYGENPDDAFSGLPDHPTHNYTASLNGNVHLKVTDTKGEFDICTAAVDVTAYPSKNIPLRGGVTPMDLAVDHGDGDLMIMYSDGQTWRYLLSAYYQTGTLFFNTTAGSDHLDVSPNGASMVGGNSDASISYCQSYSDTGAALWTHPIWQGCMDSIGATQAGFVNYHIKITGFAYGDYVWFDRMAPPTYDGGNGNLPLSLPGIGSLLRSAIRGAEAATTASDYIYVVEGAPEFRVETYNGYGSFTGTYWGGTQVDGMAGFYNPRDITRDNDNDYYVLDQLSTSAPLVKKYTAAGVQVGSFGDSTTISGTPLKIEGSDFNGNIFVLHSNGLSMFFPSEMP